MTATFLTNEDSVTVCGIGGFSFFGYVLTEGAYPFCDSFNFYEKLVEVGCKLFPFATTWPI